MSEFASIEDLTSDEVTTNTEEVELPNGKKVLVRGLTRFELLLGSKNTDDVSVVEQRNVARCMIQPIMTEKQVEIWQKSSSPDALGRVTKAIHRLSGMGKDADKSGVPEAGDGPDA